MNTSINMGNVSVGGDFNAITAENITNSFNKAAASEANADMKEALKNLALQVAELAKALPQEKAESVSRDLNTFTGEAVSKQPRQQWYELSANGLLEAAKSVTSLAAPVTTAVKAVLALIAP